MISTLENVNSIISEFGSQFNYGLMVPSLLKCYEMANPAIKNWVMEILKILFKFVKDDLRGFLTGIKENLLVEFYLF